MTRARITAEDAHHSGLLLLSNRPNLHHHPEVPRVRPVGQSTIAMGRILDPPPLFKGTRRTSCQHGLLRATHLIHMLSWVHSNPVFPLFTKTSCHCVLMPALLHPTTPSEWEVDRSCDPTHLRIPRHWKIFGESSSNSHSLQKANRLPSI